VARGGVRLLEGLNLDLQAGEIMGLYGPSGCGKTTLLRVVAALADPLDGQVRLEGALAGAIGWPRFRRCVVLVEQQPVMLDASILANLQKPFSYKSARDAFPLTRAKNLLEHLAIPLKKTEESAQLLSVGEKQRVSLVRALLLNPKVLLLDEPTSGLDETSAEKVRHLIREEATQHKLSVLVVSHDTDRLRQWCDRCIDLGTYTTEAIRA